MHKSLTDLPPVTLTVLKVDSLSQQIAVTFHFMSAFH